MTDEECLTCPFEEMLLDDDFQAQMADPLTEATKRIDFVVTLKVHAEVDPETITSLLHQYKTIMGIPGAEIAREEIADELIDISSALANYKDNYLADIAELPHTDYVLTNTAEANIIGIETRVTITDG